MRGSRTTLPEVLDFMLALQLGEAIYCTPEASFQLGQLIGCATLMSRCELMRYPLGELVEVGAR
jgi:hypothetical protein